jgi:hypothetical protein
LIDHFSAAPLWFSPPSTAATLPLRQRQRPTVESAWEIPEKNKGFTWKIMKNPMVLLGK